MKYGIIVLSKENNASSFNTFLKNIYTSPGAAAFCQERRDPLYFKFLPTINCGTGEVNVSLQRTYARFGS